LANGNEFSPHTLEFMIDPSIVATVSFRCKDGAVWTIEHLGRVIMALEMQRSFLLGTPVDVAVSIRTPTPAVLQLTQQTETSEGAAS
jgi:hypothetical protein